MHTFTYSPRPGTLSAKMKDQVNGAVASQRSDRLRELAKSMALKFHQKFIGQPIEVLVEQVKGGQASGYSEHYIPVEIQGLEISKGQLVSLKAHRATESGLIC
jgi:threonylcarbamoyladenosine tRNA methylthiotransferase MtaB